MDAREDAQMMRIRLPHDLRKWIEQQAQTNYRSMNGEIAYRLDIARNIAERSERSVETVAQ